MSTRDLHRLRELHRPRPRRLARGRDWHVRPDRRAASPTRRSSATSTATSTRTRCTALYDCHVDGSGVVLRLVSAADPQHAPEVPLPDAGLRRRASRPTCTSSTGSTRRASRSTTSPTTTSRPRAPTCSGRTPSCSRARTTSTGAAPMLDALETYLGGGGRFMYIGGNCLFGVASFDPIRPSRTWSRCGAGARRGRSRCRRASAYHSTTGEQGGTWRNRGRPPNTIVGIGTSGAGLRPGGRRTSGCRTPTTRGCGSSSRGSTTTTDRRLAEPAGQLGRRRLRVRPGRLRAGLAGDDAAPGVVGAVQRRLTAR